MRHISLTESAAGAGTLSEVWNISAAPVRNGGRDRWSALGASMVRVAALSSPFLLGFDQIERVLDKAVKTGSDGYPPYNIERLAAQGEQPERLRITLAVAGFSREDVEVTQEESQLWIRGRQQDDKTRDYIHRGIAARQFQRSFLLAEGMQVLGAELANGLLSIDIARPQPEKIVKRISVSSRE